jgi:peptidoglycan/xylan/chitin deacetylase (PgdA/CDA1 family)
MGLLRLFQFLHRHQIVIWMAHGVMDDHDHPLWIPLRPQLSRQKLDEYLRLLAKRYHFVSLMDAVEMLQGRKPVQPYSMVLTFDDGYRNNLTHALPILRRHKVPATFFVPTGFADRARPFWFDRLDYVLQHASVHGREVKVGSFSIRLDASTRSALCQSYERLRRTAKQLRIADGEFVRDMEQLACRLEAESGHALADIQSRDDWSAIATWEQIQQVATDSVTIGSHTVDHVRLARVEADIARDQLLRSKRDMEGRTGKPCLSLCYPNGDFTKETVHLARECGYLCALTAEEGLNSTGDDLMTLKRINLPPDATSREVVAQACGLLQHLSRAKNRVVSPCRRLIGRRKGNKQAESLDSPIG